MQIINKILEAIHNKNLPEALACFTEDATLIDPHYPYPTMRGLENIRAGLDWSMQGMKTFHFEIVRLYPLPETQHYAVETHCEHMMRIGKELVFDQVFLVELENNKIKSLRAFEPYRPNGLLGILLTLNHFVYRLTHKQCK